LERYADRIGALTKAELRVQKDKDEDEEYPTSERNQMRQSVVKQDDEDDEWD